MVQLFEFNSSSDRTERFFPKNVCFTMLCVRFCFLSVCLDFRYVIYFEQNLNTLLHFLSVYSENKCSWRRILFSSVQVDFVQALTCIMIEMGQKIFCDLLTRIDTKQTTMEEANKQNPNREKRCAGNSFGLQTLWNEYICLHVYAWYVCLHMQWLGL